VPWGGSWHRLRDPADGGRLDRRDSRGPGDPLTLPDVADRVELLVALDMVLTLARLERDRQVSGLAAYAPDIDASIRRVELLRNEIRSQLR